MCKADQNNLFMSVKIRISAIQFCFICGGSNYGDSFVDHFTESPCITHLQASTDVLELEILETSEVEETSTGTDQEFITDQTDIYDAKQYNLDSPRDEIHEKQNCEENVESEPKRNNVEKNEEEFKVTEGIRESDSSTSGTIVETIKSSMFTCLICGHHTRSSWRKLTQHLSLHKDPEVTVQCTEANCPEPNQLYETLEDLHRHYYLTHRQYYECESCGLILRNRTFYESHVLTHSVHKQYSCTFCDKAFKTKVQLNIHENRHTGQGRFECRFCEKRFPQRGELRNHEEQHGEEKGYSCHLCGKTFARDSYLRIHMKVHLGTEEKKKLTGKRKNRKTTKKQDKLGDKGMVILIESTSEDISWSNSFLLPASNSAA